MYADNLLYVWQSFLELVLDLCVSINNDSSREEKLIAIFNVSNGDTTKKQTYNLQINNDLICTFQHFRSDGLAECLRSAADAVDKSRYQDEMDMHDRLIKLKQYKEKNS